MNAFAIIVLALTLSANESNSDLLHDYHIPACKQVKEQWHDYLKHGQPEEFNSVRKYLDRDLRSCRMSIADIGETRGSMEMHARRATCKLRAKERMSLLVRGTKSYAEVSRTMLQKLSDCQLGLGDIGISERQLGYVLVANCVVFNTPGRRSKVSDYVALEGGVTKALPPLGGECKRLAESYKLQVKKLVTR